MISLQQGKKILLENVIDWFDDNGYQYYTNGSEKFLKETDAWIYSIMFNFYEHSSDHFNTTIFMHSKMVENIILEVGLPTVNLESYKKGENILNTIHDKVNLKAFMKERAKINLKNAEGYIEWAHLIKNYMSVDANAFINKYSQLPNVLIAIEEIEKRGLKNYLELLEGGIDHLFRALIISKLCNDANYHERKLRIANLILQPKYLSWHPYYRKLINILEETTLICA